MSELVQKSTVSDPDRKYWGFSGGYHPDLSTLFSISLFDLENWEVFYCPYPIATGANGRKITRAQYYFTTPPQSVEMSEPASVQIVPTQDGGKFTESQGQIFKDIRISGTTGLRPHPISNDFFGGSSGANLQITAPEFIRQKDDRGLDPREVTGFDELIFLRNVFRVYYDLKQNSDYARKLVMLFLDVKDNEFYIVEPITFDTIKDKSSPLTYRYNISLRTMFRFDTLFRRVRDSVNAFQAMQNVISQVRQISTDISRSLYQIAKLHDYLANLPSSLFNSIMQDGMQILSAISEVGRSGIQFHPRAQRGFVQTLKANAWKVREDLHNKYSDEFKSGPLELLRLANELVNLAKLCDTISSIEALWRGDKQIQVQDYRKAYYKELGEAPSNYGSPLNLENMKIPDKVKEVDVIGNEDIRGLAKRYLGDEAKWKVLVIVNNLKPPYISHTRSAGVLAPGDKLLIPSSSSEDAIDANIFDTVNTDQAIQSQSTTLRKYGRDIKLASVGNGYSDLVVGQNGDLELTDGLDNINQSMAIKFSTEKGELATHPDFGARFPLGTKIGFHKLQEFIISIRQTIYSDSRVDSITSLKAKIVNDQIWTSSKIKLKGSNMEIPITFTVRR